MPAAPTVHASEPPPSPLGRGASIGRYLILSSLARGAMGEVYAAYDPELDRRVALKLLHTARGSEGARRLLAREARALGKLSHPNVVQVHDVGEHDGDVFVAMELIEGQSLDAWCAGAPAGDGTVAPRPGWREVLAAYLDAARGLEAAHAKGLVHRDVKPSNILRGKDGRVRVVDFGLAAGRDEVSDAAIASGPLPATVAGEVLPLGETLPGPSSREGSLDERFTTPGVALGTPLYMAPEQHVGRGVGPASDQYSLCAALFEGLHGTPPFKAEPNAVPMREMARLLAQKKEGPPATPPPGSPVPAWVHRAVTRGLAPRPEDRYPSLDALIAALEHDAGAPVRARWRSAGIAAAGLALLAVAAAGWARSDVFRDPCARPEQQLEGVWDEGVKGRLRAAFTGTGRSYAEGTVTRVTGLLDRYGADWAAMRGEVCEASRKDPHREILARRSECLERRRGQLQALTTVLAEKPDGEVLDKAVQAASGLYPIAYCAETEALTARVRPPEDPALRARVAALQRRVDRLEALHTAGKYKDGLAFGAPLLAEARELRHPPLLAQVELWMGRLDERTGDYAGARALLRDAAVSAAEGRDDVLGAAAWARLLFVVGERQQRFEEASVIRALGPTAVARSPDDASRATWLNAEGTLLFRMGKYAEAKRTLEQALALFEKAKGPDHPDVATSLNNLANAVFNLGDYPLALSTHERALALWEKALGPDHPHVATSLSNLGNVLSAMGDYPRAQAVYERGLALREKALGPDHPVVATSLVNLGKLFLRTGDFTGAAAAHGRALALWEKTLAPDHPDVTYALAGLGRAEIHLGELATALPRLERALRIREKALGATHPALAEPLLGLGELRLARKEPSLALDVLERALALENAEEHLEIELTLAEALWRLGKAPDRARALTLAEQARATYERTGHRPGLARATRWLAEHPLEGG